MGKFENVALADGGGLVSRRLARIEERRLAGIGFRDLIMYRRWSGDTDDGF